MCLMLQDVNLEHVRFAVDSIPTKVTDAVVQQWRIQPANVKACGKKESNNTNDDKSLCQCDQAAFTDEQREIRNGWLPTVKSRSCHLSNTAIYQDMQPNNSQRSYERVVLKTG
jgi:hypothetical protein